MADPEIIAEWLAKADEDYGFASVNLDDQETSYFGLICFHYQQAAEKYLKAYIVKFDLSFERIHDLDRLRSICETHDVSFGELTDECIFLNDYYIETRYPAIWPVGTTRDDAQKAREAATRLRDHIKNLLTAS